MRFIRKVPHLWRCLIVACFWGLPMDMSVLFAQNPPKRTLSDLALLNQYDTLASSYLEAEKLEKMYLVIQKGLALAKKNNNEHYHGIFFLHTTYYFKRKYQTDSAIVYARKAIPILQRHRDWPRASHIMYRLSTLYLDRKDQASAIKQLDSLLRFNDKYNEHSYTGYAYNLLAYTFHRLNDSINEKKYILKELDFVERRNSDVERIYVYGAWATYLARQKQFQKAHTYYTKAYNIVKTQKNDEAKAELLLNMGANLISLKEYIKAFEAFKLVEKIALKHLGVAGWNAILSTNYAHISSLLLTTGKPQEALEYARRSYALVENEPFRYEYLVRALKEAKYQLEKNEKEKKLFAQNLKIKELELQNEQKQGKILWTLLGLLAISLGGGYWFYRKTQVYNYRISKKNQELETLNETKDKLFGIIGHDLRAPVADLINTITLIEHPNISPEQLSSQSVLLRKKALTLQSILNNLLYWAFSQRQILHTNPRYLSLQDNIEEALDLLSGLLQDKSLKINWQNLSSTSVYADENQVQIVLYNIIHNAIKFSPYGSTIEIAIETQNPYVVLCLTNQGSAFEWDGSTNNRKLTESRRGTLGEKGTGLGLLVCAELMKFNNGSIYARKNPTGGTSIILTFPYFHIASQ